MAAAGMQEAAPGQPPTVFPRSGLERYAGNVNSDTGYRTGARSRQITIFPCRVKSNFANSAVALVVSYRLTPCNR